MLEKIKLQLIVILSVICFLSNCDKEDIVVFNAKSSLHPQVVDNITVFTKGNVYMNVVDTFLVIQKAEEKFIKIYSTNSHKLLAEAGVKGYGPNELIRPDLIKQENHKPDPTFFIFDFAKQALFSVDLNSVITDGEFKSQEKLIDEFLVYLFYKDNEILIGAIPNGQLIIYNYKNNKKYYTFYKPDLDISIHDRYLSSIYNPTAAVNKARNLIAVAPTHLGALNFYDLEGNWLRSTVFDDLYTYKNELMAGEPSFKNIEYEIVSLEADDNYIYGLNFNNSVSNYYDNIRENNPIIQVFDWDGNPIIEYQLDERTITAFTVDEIHNRIYAYSRNEEKYNILYYKIE